MKEIGIVGFGAFGQFMACHLAKDFSVYVYDTHERKQEAEKIHVKIADFDSVVGKEIVILAMPMDKLEKVLIDMKGKTKNGALVMDICSLKGFAEKLMKKHLKNVEIIGMHPLFGPQTATNLKDCKIALCNFAAREETFGKVKEFCERLGLKTYITTAKEHDRQMAKSQAITHFVALTLNNLPFEKVEMSTKTTDKMLEIVEIVKKHPPVLFEDMNVYNEEARTVRKRFLKEAQRLDKHLDDLEKD